MSRTIDALLLCTGNGAPSILAAILKRDRPGRFRAFSAGSVPKRQTHPAALRDLGELGYETQGAGANRA